MTAASTWTNPNPNHPIMLSASLFTGRRSFFFSERRISMNGDNNQSHKSNDFPEAPASWNTRYVDPNGFECQITLRGETGSELLEKAASAISYLLQNGCTPYVFYRNGNHQMENKSNGDKKDELQSNGKDKNNGSWCPIHQCEMKRWDKEGRVW